MTFEWDDDKAAANAKKHGVSFHEAATVFGHMKKAERDELRPEYRREDLGRGVRGKYLKAYRAGTNLVLLRPEVAAAFPTEQAVNDALGSLIEVARNTADLRVRSVRRTKKARG